MPASPKSHNTQELSVPARQSPIRNTESHQPHGQPTAPVPAMQQAFGNRALQRLLPQLQRMCAGCEELRAPDPSPAPPRAFTSGLPGRLKTGVETLSGMAMDSVKVHYNSPDPARVQALAYTQGTEIHVAPGQEKHLAHEAWHVVQQQQGRVRPTMQLGGTAINDDSSLEKEADAMGDAALIGACAPAQDRAATEHKGQPTVQRSVLTKVRSDDVETPAGVIKNQLKIDGKDQRLPGTQPVGNRERAKKVEATIKNDTLRKSARGDSGNLAAVTAMARAEEMILQGADMKGFYDAGHLVADQLVDGDVATDSFVLWNLAPQAMELNAPTYAQILEEEIKSAVKDAGKQPQKRQAGGANVPATTTSSNVTVPSNAQVNLTVEVEYPNNDQYTVTVNDLVQRGVISQPGHKKPTDPITFPRRIPSKWKATARLESTLGAGATQPEFPEIEKRAGKGQLAENFVSSLSGRNPTIGTPFFFTVNNASQPPLSDKLKIGPSPLREFEATQWTPAAGGAREEDIISHIAKIFPDLGTKDKIIQKLAPENLMELENQVLSEQAATMVEALNAGLTANLSKFASEVKSKIDGSKKTGIAKEDRKKYLEDAQEIINNMKKDILAQNQPAATTVAPSPVLWGTRVATAPPMSVIMQQPVPTPSGPVTIPILDTGDTDMDESD